MLRFGIVGTGFGLYGILPALRRDPRCAVVGICGSSPDRARELVAARLPEGRRPLVYASPSALMDAGRLDGLAIAVPPRHQEAVAREALDRGLAVFAEKPLAATLAAAEDLGERASRGGRANMVDFIFPELEPWKRARDTVAAGGLGSVRAARLRWVFESHAHRTGLASWKRDPAQGGGVLLHFGSHAFHDLEFLLGPIARVEAARVAADRVTARLSLASGAAVDVELDSARRTAHEHAIEVDFTDGSLALRNTSGDHVRGFTLDVRDRAGRAMPVPCHDEPEPPAGDDSRVEPVGRLLSRFADWIAAGTPTRPTFADGVRAQRIIDAVERCALSGPCECGAEA